MTSLHFTVHLNQFCHLRASEGPRSRMKSCYRKSGLKDWTMLRNSSSLAPSSDLKLTGIRCRDSKGLSLSKKSSSMHRKLRKIDSHRKDSFSELEGAPSEFSSDTERKQILTHKNSDQTEKRLDSDREKQRRIQSL
jgi:hypothetical protein